MRNLFARPPLSGQAFIPPPCSLRRASTPAARGPAEPQAIEAARRAPSVISVTTTRARIYCRATLPLSACRPLTSSESKSAHGGEEEEEEELEEESKHDRVPQLPSEGQALLTPLFVTRNPLTPPSRSGRAGWVIQPPAPRRAEERRTHVHARSPEPTTERQIYNTPFPFTGRRFAGRARRGAARQPAPYQHSPSEN